MADEFFALPPAPAPKPAKKRTAAAPPTSAADDAKKELRKKELRLAEQQRGEYARMAAKLEAVPGAAAAATRATALRKVAELDAALARLRQKPTTSKTWRRGPRPMDAVAGEAVKPAVPEGGRILRKYQVTAVGKPEQRAARADDGDDFLAAPEPSAVASSLANPAKRVAAKPASSAQDILRKYSSTAAADLPRAGPTASAPSKPKVTLARAVPDPPAPKRPPTAGAASADLLALPDAKKKKR